MTENFARVDTDLTELLLGNNFKKKDILIEAGEVIEKGMLLGKIKFVVGSATAGISNVGDGTITEFAFSAIGMPKVGVYNLICITAVTNGGIFKLTDPDGIVISSDITLPVSEGSEIVFEGQGITFKITDGTTDFDADDLFTLEIEAGSGNLKQTISTSLDGSQYPVYVAISDDDASLGLVETEVIASGEINIGKMLFSGIEDIETQVDGKTYYNYLRDYGILALESETINSYDNA